MVRKFRRVVIGLACLALAPDALADEAASPLTLDAAIELALTRNLALQVSQQDLEVARAQIDEAWGTVYPQVDLTARYVRTIETPSPFAGSDADGLFSSFAVLPWLAYNESARQAGGQGLSLEDYFAGCADGSLPPEAGCSGGDSGGDNPFLIPNTASATLAISQIIYSGRAFAAIDAAEIFEAQQLDGVRQQSLKVVADVARSYHGAQLIAAQVKLLEGSIERLRVTLAEITRRVELGVLPKFQQLSMEVEVANIDSQLVQARQLAADALDGLKLNIGVPVDGQLALTTALAEPAAAPPLARGAEAMALAEKQRPDLSQLARTRQLLVAQRELTSAEYLPTVSAFANLGVQGSIPDDPDGGPFSSDYWGPSVNAGVQLSWNLFSGLATDARVRQRDIELRRTDLQLEQLRQVVRLDIERALRAIDSARSRLDAQTKTVERAQLNYRHAEARVKEGVAAGIELREASQQLGESRNTQLQALHDLLLAYIDYQVAVGTPPSELRGTGPVDSGDSP